MRDRKSHLFSIKFISGLANIQILFWKYYPYKVAVVVNQINQQTVHNPTKTNWAGYYKITHVNF